jgi:hypothetical protein
MSASGTMPVQQQSVSTTLFSNTTFGTSKRKLAESFVDENDDQPERSIMTTTPLTRHLSIKRPRTLDMNRIRSLVLAGDESIANEPFHLHPSSKHQSEWKQFSTYEAYQASKIPINLEVSHSRPFRLPILTHRDYCTRPTIDELRVLFDKQGHCFVKEFTVTREHYGSVTFQGDQMNLAGLDLNRLSK